MKPFFTALFHALWTDPTVAAKIFGLALVFILLWKLRKWPVLQPVLHALWYDEAAVKTWAWGLGGFLATLGSSVFIGSSVEEAMSWPAKRWVAQILTSLVAMGVAMVNPRAKKAEADPAAPPAPNA